MTLVIARHIRDLVRSHPGLVTRFAATSLGRTALAMASILLIREFLGGAVGSGGGLAAALAFAGAREAPR